MKKWLIGATLMTLLSGGCYRTSRVVAQTGGLMLAGTGVMVLAAGTSPAAERRDTHDTLLKVGGIGGLALTLLGVIGMEVAGSEPE